LRRWSKVKKEGSPEHFFAEDTPTEEPSEEVEQGGLELATLEGNEYAEDKRETKLTTTMSRHQKMRLLPPHPTTLAPHMVTGGSLVHARDGQRALEAMVLSDLGSRRW
jgi:hypothetical protein